MQSPAIAELDQYGHVQCTRPEHPGLEKYPNIPAARKLNARSSDNRLCSRIEGDNGAVDPLTWAVVLHGRVCRCTVCTKFYTHRSLALIQQAKEYSIELRRIDPSSTLSMLSSVVKGDCLPSSSQRFHSWSIGFCFLLFCLWYFLFAPCMHQPYEVHCGVVCA